MRSVGRGPGATIVLLVHEQVKPWFYNLPPAGLAGVNPRGCAEKFKKAQY